MGKNRGRKLRYKHFQERYQYVLGDEFQDDQQSPCGLWLTASVKPVPEGPGPKPYWHRLATDRPGHLRLPGS